MRVALLVGIVLVHATGVADADTPTAERVAALIKQLDDPEATKREAARLELIKIGEAALPALRIREREQRERQERTGDAIAKILKKARISTTTGMEMVVIKSGGFQMGSPGNETGRLRDEPAHAVRITSAFLLGKFEVTQREYRKVMAANPSGFKQESRPGGMQYPVDSVSWFDAIAFCNRLSKLDGFKPYYALKNARYNGGSIATADVSILGGKGYRLPTEAEWEYACRAKTKTAFYFGTRNTGKESNVKASSYKGSYGSISKRWKDHKKPVAVGSYPANAWGLHDMLGNLGEWVYDWYDKGYYGKSPKNDPPGPKSGRHRVIRGGNWLLYEEHARCASRYYQTPNERKNFVGFRVARTP